MSDYWFSGLHKVYSPNGAVGERSADEVEAHNRNVETATLLDWDGKPDHFAGYVEFPHQPDLDNRPWQWTARNHRYNCRSAILKTWLGTIIGTGYVSGAFINNLGALQVCVRIKGTNGADYFGRFNPDNGQLIRLRKAKT